MKTLEKEAILENTLVIFTSDNGPVLNDGYYDDAVEKLGAHKPSGPFRGGKYSLYEAGTRVPFITFWKDRIKPGVSNALVCQLDFFASLAKLVGSDLKTQDSKDLMQEFLGESGEGREALVIEATTRTALRKGDWIMIPPYKGPKKNDQVNIELGNSSGFQLYNLKDDKGQQHNLAESEPEQLAMMIEAFTEIRGVNFEEVEQLELK